MIYVSKQLILFRYNPLQQRTVLAEEAHIAHVSVGRAGCTTVTTGDSQRPFQTREYLLEHFRRQHAHHLVRLRGEPSCC
jgi:hypothetical protein